MDDFNISRVLSTHHPLKYHWPKGERRVIALYLCINMLFERCKKKIKKKNERIFVCWFNAKTISHIFICLYLLMCMYICNGMRSENGDIILGWCVSTWLYLCVHICISRKLCKLPTADWCVFKDLKRSRIV